MNDLVSIIVAIYNAEKDLDRCIASICDQTYVNIQIILIDDGSTDRSSEICDKWLKKDSRVVAKHLDNKGVSGARNEGIMCAKGTYLTFVDADDWIEKNYIETLMHYYQKDSLVCCGYITERMMPNRKTRHRLIRYSDREKDVVSRQNVISVYMSELFSAVWNKLYETTLLRENNIQFPVNYSLGEDILFNIQYINVLCGEIIVVNSIGYHYVIKNGSSLSRKYYKDFYDIQKNIYERLLAYMNCVKATEEQMMSAYSLYINALIVSFDNLYLNKKNMSRRRYNENFISLVQRREIPELISRIKGTKKIISFIRWKLICYGLFPLEYCLRTFIKKILRLE